MREVQTKFPGSKVVRERYIVDELLGQGGFGAVYRVRDRRAKDNIFALKEITDPNKHQRESFTFEGELLRRLDHPHLPRVYRTFEDEKQHRLYMLMDYIDGPNLEHLRVQQPERRFSFSQTLKIMAPIIEAIAYLHAQNPPIVHRDIKPANIIVLTSGESASLVDFGIAKEYDLDATTTAIRHCSPGYGAPEQYICDTNTRTDIYGLGATFYTLLTGEVPIDSLYRITSMSGRGTDPLVPLKKLAPEIPAPVADIILRALAINNNERFPSVEAFWEVLKAYDIEKVTDVLPVEASSILDESFEESLDSVSPAKHQVNEGEALGTGLAPGSFLIGNSLPLRWGTGTMRKHGQMFLLGLISLMIVALSAGAIFETGQHFAVKRTISDRATSGEVSKYRSVGHGNRSMSSPLPTVARRSHDLVPDYNGTIHNIFANVHDTMSLTQMRQVGSSIKGYFIVGPALIGNGYFTGSITDDNKIQFLVLTDTRILPLFFKGEFHIDGSISGSYCSYQNHQCNYVGGGYGQWHVLPHTV